MNLVLVKNISSTRTLRACYSACGVSQSAVRHESSHPASSRLQPGDGKEKEAHLLHAVWRIRSLKGRPYWEKDIMKQLQLDTTRRPVVHKNTPLVNSLLTKVRHLVRIKAVNPVFGLPDGDYDETVLKWNGDFVVKRKIEPHAEQNAAISDGLEKEEKVDTS